MTVKEVFELRKQGKIEEAYDAIRPMYAVHKGKYTTLCMFWTASDILKKRLTEKKTAEAEKIFQALLRVWPNVEDKDGKAHSAILHAALRLSQESKTFSMLGFVQELQVETLTNDDWKAGKTDPSPSTNEKPHPLPSTAQRLLTCCFHEIQRQPSLDNALKVMPLLQEAVRRNPRSKHNLRYMAVIYKIMGERQKAIDIYRQLLTRHRDSFLFAELAELTADEGPKAALLCRAIVNQRQEKFNTGYRQALAILLLEKDKRRAAYELQKCLAVRKALGYPVSNELRRLQDRLAGVSASSDAEQRTFYQKMMEKFPL